MKKFLYPAALLLMVAAVSSCRREEKECDLARIDQLNQRESLLNQREQALSAREAALASRESSSGSRALASGGSYQSSSNAGYAAGSTGTAATGKVRSLRRTGSNEPGLNAGYTGTRSAIPGQYPEASERALTEADVRHLSPWGRQVMLNEIYARHHYIFPDKTLQAHFNQEYWYRGTERKLGRIRLSVVEKQNIAYLQ